MTEGNEPYSFEHSYPIITIPMYSGNTFDWFIKTVWTLFTDWHNRVFAKKFLSTLNIKHSTFNLVLCTTFSDFPLGAAQRIAQTLNVPLICDIRDLDEQVDHSVYQYHHQSKWLMPFRRLYRTIHIRRRNKVLRAADAITTVSPWHADFIQSIVQSSIFNLQSSIIYNGFDAHQFYPEDVHTEEFRITYIGSLHDWQQPALEKVKAVIDDINRQSSIVQSSITLDLHTPQHHPLAHTELGDAIRRSSIILVLTGTHTHGMLTTKFYEALGCSKPVLCVPSDQGDLAELIAYTNAGIATDDTRQIHDFIMEQYRQWQLNGYTAQPTIHRLDFSRETQCEHMEQIIKSSIVKSSIVKSSIVKS